MLSGFVVFSPLVMLEADPHRSGTVWGLTILACGLVMIAASAAFVAFNNGSTPGKAIVGLRVAGLRGYRGALRREAYRCVPFLAVYLSMQTLAADQTLPDPLPLIGSLLIVAAIFGLIWYAAFPLFAVSGDYHARWDKIVGSRVERIPS